MNPSFMKNSCLPHALLFFVLLSISFHSCKDGAKEQVVFNPHISGFTSGVVSNQTAIRVLFTNPVPGVIAGTTAESNLLRISPSVDGQALWVDNQTLVFKADRILDSDTEHRVTLKLGKLIEGEDDFVFRFRTMRQGFRVDDEGMENTTEDLRTNQYFFQLITADYMPAQMVETLVEAYQDGTKLEIGWEHNDVEKKHHLVVRNIIRSAKAGTLELKYPTAIDHAGGDAIQHFEVPAIGNFKVMNVKAVLYPDQYLQIAFSDPIDPRQNLAGLITIDETDDLRYSVEKNKVTVYPPLLITGTKKVAVHQGVLNTLGKPLGVEAHYDVMFENLKPEVQFINKGTIMPRSTGLILPFKAVSLSAVEVRVIKLFENNIPYFLQTSQLDGDGIYELKRAGRLILKKTIRLDENPTLDLARWNTFSLNLSALMEPDPGAIYRITISFKKQHALYPCIDNEAGNEALPATVDDEKELRNEQLYWDAPDSYYSYWDDYQDYDWYQHENPCHNSYYFDRAVGLNLLASDLGIIAKQGNDRRIQVAVTSLVTTKPIAGVSLEVLSYQNQTIGVGTTDKDGLAMISVQGTPYLLIAKQNKERGYLRLDDGSSLSLSRFDVAGQTMQQGMKGFVYGERGVWRPGDSIFVSFILENKGIKLPDSHPVLFELINPQGKVVQKQIQNLAGRSILSFRSATPADAITGMYTARVLVGGARFDKSLRVETIKPNRLKINLDFPSGKLYYGQTVPATLSAHWLHGATARNLKASISVTLSQSTTSFDGYPGFVFDDPVRTFATDESVIFEGKLNENGIAQVNPSISVHEAAPGMLKASFYTRVFEEGGNFSLDRFTMAYAPYRVFVGVKVPNGDKRGMLITDQNHRIEVVTVNADGRSTDVNGLTYEVYKVNWRWWWEANDNDLASYTGGHSRNLIAAGKLNTRNGKGSFEFMVKYPDWGRYLVRVVDPVNGHACGKPIYVDWPGWSVKPMGDDAQTSQMLLFALDKEKYNVGDKATLTFPSAAGGRALVSIENGYGVLHSLWVETHEGTTSCSFEVTPQMTPNVYANISLLQPHGQTVNNLPIRMYGVMPVMVENPQTHLTPLIDMASELRPEQTVEIKVSEKERRAMSYTLAVVDEGLLDITRFGTPQPWQYFFAREALGVKTWDLYGWVLGAYGGRIEQAFAIGGDGELDGKRGGDKQNRFKPVVRFIGPFHIGKGEIGRHRVSIPRYVGSVRVMVVAASENAYGSTEKTVPVRSPLMVLTTLPRVCSPDEHIVMPVTLFTMEKQSQHITVDIASHDGFSVIGSASQQVEMAGNSEKVVYFLLKANASPAAGNIKVVAKSGNEQAIDETALSIRPANPVESRSESAMVKAGETVTLKPHHFGIRGTETITLEVSAIPPLNLGERLHYLLHYPHGCAEQTTSAAFPQLYLTNLVENTENISTTVTQNIMQAINRLAAMQIPDGGIANWPGHNMADDWTTSYVGYFLSEAGRKGYVLPDGFMKRWIGYQRKASQQWSYNKAIVGNNELQAFRLFSLAQAGAADLSSMNRMRKINSLSVMGRWYLAAAYARAGYADVGRELIASLPSKVDTQPAWHITYGSETRDLAMMLETYNLLKMNEEAFGLVQKISSSLSSQEWMSTQTTAYSLLAISHYLENNGVSKSFEFALMHQGKKSIHSSQKAVFQKAISSDEVNLNLTNNGSGSLYARVVTTGIPAAGDEKSNASNLSLSVDYYDLSGNELDVSKLIQGNDLMAVVTVRNPGTLGALQNIALTQMVPSGWEIRNTRMDEVVDYQSSTVDYQDFRDDRVLSYFNLAAGETKRIVTLMHATYGGKFYLPAIHCQAMYDNRASASVAGQWVSVDNE